MWLYNLWRKPHELGRKRSFISAIQLPLLRADPAATIENRHLLCVDVDFPVMILL